MLNLKYLTTLAMAMCLVGCNQSPDTTKPASNATQDSKTPVASTSTATSTNTASNTQADPNLPTYKVLIDATYPPFESKNSDGTVGGMEVEIFNAIAKDQGFNVNYIPHAWDGMFDALKAKEGAIMVSAIGMTDEAKANAELSDVYYITPYRVTSLDAGKLDNWQTLPKIGIAESEDSAEDLPNRYQVKPEQLVKYKTVFMALAGLAKGEVDAVVADATVSQYNAGSEAFKAQKDKFVGKNLEIKDSSKLVFAVEKGNTDLLAKINKGLANVKASGKLAEILQKYHQAPATDVATATSQTPASAQAKS